MEPRTQSKSHTVNLADIFVQGAMKIVDMQTSAARVFLQTQGRSARMFGAPDWSHTLNGPSEQISQLISTGAEQAMNLFRQTNETISELNQQFGQLVQQQTAQLAQEMRVGMKEVSRRAEESLEDLRQTTEQATREVKREVKRSEESRPNGSRQRRGRQRSK
jgi:gas vesicle protein